jgi:NitT/TauT family transport system ATP-binding protein
MTDAPSQIAGKIALEARNLSKVYPHSAGPLTAIEKVNLTVRDGEIVSIVGPSGCGKTTLLRLLAGLNKPDGGSVAITKNSNASRTSGRTSFVFQKPLLFPWRTVEENVLLPIEVQAAGSPAEVGARCTQLLNSLGLSNFRHSHPNQLSGGMAQRASIARALINEPEILFLDEPLSAVDEITRERLWLDFRRLWRERHLSIVLVTHSIREAVFFGDRVLVMSPRPGTIIGEISVALSTRSAETLYHSDYTALCDSVRQALGRTKDEPPK